MSDAIEQNTQTQDAKPLKDWRRIIAASSLPDGPKRLIETVVRKTRLWKRERAAVAVELIAHFHDAADAGVPSEEAIKRFGDARQAAKLIRRAKIRNRSWLWHARRFAQRVLVMLILCYIGVGVYYYSGKPSPSVDYVAKLNAPILATPESEWAWPLYREAAMTIKADPLPDGRWGEAGWSDTVQWLDRNRACLDTIRAASARPSFGFPFAQFSPEDVALFGKQYAADTSRSSDLRPVIGLLLPYVGEMRVAANALADDAMRGMELGDGHRVEADILALYRTSEQLRKRGFVVIDLVSISIRKTAQTVLGRVLYDAPTLLSDESLLKFSRLDAEVRTGSDLIDYRGERFMFYDLVQRIYTDDGEGDGRITPEGFAYLRGLFSATDASLWNNAWDEWALRTSLAPSYMLMSVSRKQLVERYDAMMNLNEKLISHALRSIDADEIDKSILEFNAASSGLRYQMLQAMFPVFTRVPVAAERSIARQEAIKVAIAIEQWRRRNGRYPESLRQLVPTFMPSIPADRISGSELRYRIEEGKPLLYSVGADMDDDGGTFALKHNGIRDPDAAAEWFGTVKPDGDWVLFPPP